MFRIPVVGTSIAQRVKSARSMPAVRFGGADENHKSRRVGVDSIAGEPLDISQLIDGNHLSHVQSLPQGQLELEYDKPYVIGRAEGEHVPYLAPHLQATRQVPGSIRKIPVDPYVSRAHFQLIARKEGLDVTNGVPASGGGIHSPRNGTYLLEPGDRPLLPGETYHIESGKTAKIRLGPHTILLLSAGDAV